MIHNQKSFEILAKMVRVSVLNAILPNALELEIDQTYWFTL